MTHAALSCPNAPRRAAAQATARRAVGGQALVEFVVAAAFLLPLFFAVVIVGRLQDVRSATVQAARYGAFAQALTPASSDQIQSEIRARFYAANSHWQDPSRRATPLVHGPEDVTLRVRNAAPPGLAQRGMSTAVSAIDGVQRLTAGRFDLERRGFHAADVEVRLAPVPLLVEFGAPPVTLRAHATVLGRDWAAAGPAQAATRTAALAPTASLQRVRPLLTPLTWALALLEPAIRDLCLGRADPELVPLDRLGAAGTDDPGRWSAPCE